MLRKIFQRGLAIALYWMASKVGGGICFTCGEKYVGLALDCRCTNWGKPL